MGAGWAGQGGVRGAAVCPGAQCAAQELRGSTHRSRRRDLPHPPHHTAKPHCHRTQTHTSRHPHHNQRTPCAHLYPSRHHPAPPPPTHSREQLPWPASPHTRPPAASTLCSLSRTAHAHLRHLPAAACLAPPAHTCTTRQRTPAPSACTHLHGREGNLADGVFHGESKDSSHLVHVHAPAGEGAEGAPGHEAGPACQGGLAWTLAWAPPLAPYWQGTSACGLLLACPAARHLLRQAPQPPQLAPTTPAPAPPRTSGFGGCSDRRPHPRTQSRRRQRCGRGQTHRR